MKNSVAALIAAWTILLCFAVPASAEDAVCFSGSGTARDPYRISTAEDLCQLAAAVNAGNTFSGKYFVQTQDIDLANTVWFPIGEYGAGNYFYGVYDGNGHHIDNFTATSGGYEGLFGQLGGTVMNLGIERGSVSGVCVGSIASHSCSSSAIIINCYSKASLSGFRAGGIADNFNGSVLNCWSDCELTAPDDGQVGGITAFGAVLEKNNHSLRSYDQDIISAPNGTQTAPEISTEQLVSLLNNSLYDSANAVGIRASALNTWQTDEQGSPVMSQKKYTFRFADLPMYIRFNMIYIVPVCIALFALALLLVKVPQKR